MEKEDITKLYTSNSQIMLPQRRVIKRTGYVQKEPWWIPLILTILIISFAVLVTLMPKSKDNSNLYIPYVHYFR